MVLVWLCLCMGVGVIIIIVWLNVALNYHALQAFTTTRHVSQYRSDLADIDLLVDRPSRSTKGSNRSWTGVDEAARTDRPNLFRVGQQPNAVAPERQSERFQQHRPSSPARASAARAQPQALAQRQTGDGPTFEVRSRRHVAERHRRRGRLQKGEGKARLMQHI